VNTLRKLLSYFPGAVAVSDNHGNLPIHTAASVMKGEVGAAIAAMLLEEADNQAKSPTGTRFRNKSISKDAGDISLDGEAGLEESEDIVLCNLVRNDNGETPLMTAIKHHADWQIIESIVKAAGGIDAILSCDSAQNNALHLLVSDPENEPASVMSMLKLAPQAACCRNDDGMLPIEIACRQNALLEVVSNC